MQLVTDCVTMYDTMKDRRIGVAEVIEKFGVPPEKVVEVQALAGDSVDNVPGVPGIGIKTAAQLITEYGDLETLLARAAEIKQPKRREALIENAEKARISRQLVLLDDKVKLDVPLDELAVHEPDARKLVAFLKAMEFTTLTRRVADYSQIDPSDVEAETALKSSPLPLAGEVGARSATGGGTSTDGDLFSGQVPSPQPSPASGGGSAPQALQGGAVNAGRGRDGKPGEVLSPQILAAKRAEAARKIAVDRASYKTVRTRDELQGWIARIHDAGFVAVDAIASSIDPMQAELCGIALALGPNDACYIPVGHRQTGDGSGLFAAGLAPDQLGARDVLEALRPLLESAGLAKIGFNIKFTAVLLAQHGISVAQHRRPATDVLCARRRPRQPWARRAQRKQSRPHAACARRADRQRQGQDRLRSGADRPRHRIWRRARRRRAAAVAGAEAAADRRADECGVRDAGASAGRRAGADGAARHLDRSQRAVAAVGGFRPDRGADRGGDPRARRRGHQHRQPEAARRHPVRQDGPARWQQDQDRRVVDLGAGAR